MNVKLGNTKNTFSQFVSDVYRHIGQGKELIRKAGRKKKTENIKLNTEWCNNIAHKSRERTSVCRVFFPFPNGFLKPHLVREAYINRILKEKT